MEEQPAFSTGRPLRPHVEPCLGKLQRSRFSCNQNSPASFNSSNVNMKPLVYEQNNLIISATAVLFSRLAFRDPIPSILIPLEVRFFTQPSLFRTDTSKGFPRGGFKTASTAVTPQCYISLKRVIKVILRKKKIPATATLSLSISFPCSLISRTVVSSLSPSFPRACLTWPASLESSSL